MKKILVIFLFASYGISLNAQNWLMYTTSNSNSPYDQYFRMAIDTANNKYFDWRAGAGDKIIFFDNDTTWQAAYNNYMGGAWNTRMMKFDKKNILWENSSGNAVYSLANGIGGAWEYYDGTTTGVYAMNGILDIAVDRKNNKWFAGYYGLTKYNDTVFTAMDTASHTLPFGPSGKVVTDKYDNVWVIGGSNKLGKYDGNSWQVFTTPFNANNTYKMIADSNGAIWCGLGAFGGGVYKFDGIAWTNYNTSNSAISTDGIFALAVDKNNNIWTCYTGGLTRFDGATWTNFDASVGFPATIAGYPMIDVDRYNNIWDLTGSGVVVFNETGVVGVNEINKQMAVLHLFPNPSKDAVTLNIETEKPENVSLTILNSLGQSVKATETRSIQKGKTDLQIDVSQLKSGIYFIQVQSSRGIVSKKFIRQ